MALRQILELSLSNGCSFITYRAHAILTQEDQNDACTVYNFYTVRISRRFELLLQGALWIPGDGALTAPDVALTFASLAKEMGELAVLSHCLV